MTAAEYVVVITRPWLNETGHGWNHYSDLKRFPSRAEAIRHGFTLDESDDFNVTTLVGDRVVANGWMDTDFEPDDDLPEIARQLGLRWLP